MKILTNNMINTSEETIIDELTIHQTIWLMGYCESRITTLELYEEQT